MKEWIWIAALAAAGCAAFAVVTPPALAEGALAIGTTGDVAKDGIAYGWSYNYRTREAAIKRALDQCRGRQQGPVERCRIVATFRRKCVAVAEDPVPGTPGTGWAFGPDKRTAVQQALAACRAASVPPEDTTSVAVEDGTANRQQNFSAGNGQSPSPGRWQDNCKLDGFGCDTHD